MRSSAALLFLVLALAAGCSPREHTNPFDPENSATGGTPDILTAIAGDGRVTLQWQLGPIDDLDHIRVRRTSGAVSTVLADSLGPATRTFTDSLVVNEATYEYVLELFFRRQVEPARTRPSLATPGRRVIWMLDQRNGGPILVSPDGRRRVAVPGSGRPSDLDVLAASGSVVAVDFYANRVERFDRHGALTARKTLEGSPLSVTFVPGDSSVWVGTFGPSGVNHLSAGLAAIVETDSLAGVPEDLAYDATRGDLWVADSDQRRVVHRHSDGTLVAIGGFRVPFSIAVDPVTGDAWMADRVQAVVFRLSRATDTVVASSREFVAPYQVIADPSGGAWVTDSAVGKVVHLDAAGAVANTITGFKEPAGIALDTTGDLWVTDRTTGELVRVSPAGDVVSRSGGFSGPFAVVVATPAD